MSLAAVIKDINLLCDAGLIERRRDGRVVVEPPHRLVMDWRWGDDADNGGLSEVEVVLWPVTGGTEMSFTHRKEIDKASRDGHEQGWNGALDKPVAALEGAD